MVLKTERLAVGPGWLQLGHSSRQSPQCALPIDSFLRLVEGRRNVIHRGRRWVMRFDLRDEEWSVLEPLMPKSRKSARPHDRRIINAIFYVLRTGIPWRDLPERYGPYTSAYNRFNRWSRRGVWKRIFNALAAKSREFVFDR
jgi:transposase